MKRTLGLAAALLLGIALPVWATGVINHVSSCTQAADPSAAIDCPKWLDALKLTGTTGQFVVVDNTDATYHSALTTMTYTGNVLSIENSTNAQGAYLYNTKTDASNYERAGLFWSGNEFRISTEALGSGSGRSIVVIPAAATFFTVRSDNGFTAGIRFDRTGVSCWEVNQASGFFVIRNRGSGCGAGADSWLINASNHWLPGADGTQDIGASGNRLRDYFGAGKITSTGATAGLGYATGAGGTVTQLTSKSTGVTMNKITGQITMNAAALAGDTTVTFTLTNSAIAAGDALILNHISAGTAGAYMLNAQSAAGSAAINVRNITTGSLSEAIVISFTVIKAVTS